LPAVRVLEDLLQGDGEDPGDLEGDLHQLGQDPGQQQGVGDDVAPDPLAAQGDQAVALVLGAGLRLSQLRSAAR
jgi:hypothetical protein